MQKNIDIEKWIDQRPLGALQVTAIVLCALIAMLDGFDTQAIAFVAPVLAKEWDVAVTGFGTVFGAGLLGLAMGSLAMGPLADKWGRKAVIIIAVTIFGVCSLATAFVQSMEVLIALRFLTGLGLGGAVPNLIALTSEYSPSRHRTVLTTLMWAGFPLWAVIGGLASSWLIPAHGWGSVFVVGGALPLILALCLVLWLPESIRYLAAVDHKRHALDRLLNKLIPGASHESIAVVQRGREQPKAPVAEVFTKGRLHGTLLLWVIFFSNLLILYFLINWLPYVLRHAGLPIEQAIIGTVVLNASGIAGGLFLGKLVDMRGPIVVLPASYLLAALSIAAIGYAPANIVTSIVAIAFAGFFVIGAQFCMNAFAAGYYPTTSRASGMGLAFGVGRIGSILGPVLGGFILANNWSTTNTFVAAALPALICAYAVWQVGILKSHRVREERNGTTASSTDLKESSPEVPHGSRAT